MKKTIIFTIAGVFMCAAAFGAYSITDLTTMGLTGKLSTNVKMGYAAAADFTGYVAGTSHTSGTKSFGSSSGDSQLWVKDGLEADLPAAPTGTASADFVGKGGWSTL